MFETVQEAYLLEARKADQKADQCLDPGAAEIWRQIANNYRVLAADLERAGKQGWH